MIDIKNLTYKTFDKTILDDINISILNNEIVTLVGQNGSGKSTLIKCIASLLKYDGKITINNNDLTMFKPKKRSQTISYLPQNNLRTNIKVSTLIRHGRFPYKGFGERLTNQDKSIIKNVIKTTQVEDILHKSVNQISGGEKQLAYLSMILAQDTPIILLDEPTTYLDISKQAFLSNVIKDLKNSGKTIVLVLHDILQALEISDKVIVIEEGKILDYGRPKEVVSSIEKVFNIKINYSFKDHDMLYKYYYAKE